ncbi:MAG TPA: DUF2262 domain-containing protein, partial [Spirochaetota bacterium]
GSAGQTKEKVFASAGEALAQYEKLIAEKISEGYAEKGKAPADASGNDKTSLQGLWKLTSCIARGDEVISSVTHLFFDGDRVKRIDPHEVDGGGWDSFALDEKVSPKRFTLTSEWEGRNGVKNTRIDRWLYELKGDTLRLCWPSVFGVYPDSFSDTVHGVETFTRDKGAFPETKKASGTKPITDAVLGTLVWDDRFDRWETRISFGAKTPVDVSIETGGDNAALKRAGKAITRLQTNEPAARLYAAEQLLESYNDNWNDGKPITVAAFAKKITLESVSIGPDGECELYYDDGDLFAGHCIIVSMDAKGGFTGADIAG